MESKVVLVLGGDFSNESLERKLSDEELSGFLVSSDLSKSDGTGSISVGLLDSSGWCVGFLGNLLGNRLSGLFSSGVLSSSLLSSGHFN